MPVYDYQCSKCSDIEEKVHSIHISEDYYCDLCGANMKKVILTAPHVSIAPQHQASGSVFDYYGIDPKTGDGIDVNGDYSTPPGIKVKS